MDVTEDGQYVVYGSIMPCNRPDGDLDSCRTHQIVHADGRSPDALGGVVQSHAITMWPGAPLAVTRGVDVSGPGDEEVAEWFDEDIIDTADLDVSRDESLLAVAGCDYDAVDSPLGCAPLVRFWGLTEAPPAQPTRIDSCALIADEENRAFDDVSMSPDGTAFVYTERGAEEELDQAAITVQLDFSVDPCSGGDELTLARGARPPHWGAADYDPTGGPSTRAIRLTRTSRATRVGLVTQASLRRSPTRSTALRWQAPADRSC